MMIRISHASHHASFACCSTHFVSGAYAAACSGCCCMLWSMQHRVPSSVQRASKLQLCCSSVAALLQLSVERAAKASTKASGQPGVAWAWSMLLKPERKHAIALTKP